MDRLRWKYVYACALKPRFGGSERELFERADLAWQHLRHLDPTAVATLEVRSLRSKPGRGRTTTAVDVVDAVPGVGRN